MSLSLVGLVIVHKKNNTRCLDNTDERPVPGIEEEKKKLLLSYLKKVIVVSLISLLFASTLPEVTNVLLLPIISILYLANS